MIELEKVSVLAGRQAGVVSRRQLLKLGVSRDAVKRALAAKVLVKLHRGVFRLPGSPMTARLRMWAAVLWADFKGVLSHRTAGHWFWGLSGLGRQPPWQVELLIPNGHAVKAPTGVKVRLTRKLEKGRDWVEQAGLPVTSVPRTLVDLAGVLSASDLEKAVDSARRKHHVADEKALERLDQLGHRGRRGAATLEAVATRDPLRRTGSELEQDVRDALEEAGIPRPMPQVALTDLNGDQIGVVDFTWHKSNVVLFVQSHRWHRSREAFEKDNRQMSALSAMGWRVMRVTWKDLKDPTSRFFDLMRAVLTIDLPK